MALNFKMEATATATVTAWPHRGHATDTATPRYSPKIGRFTVDILHLLIEKLF